MKRAEWGGPNLARHCRDRAFPYSLAILTELRRGELKRLLWADVHLEDAKPWIEVRAATTKSKRPATMFLVPQLVHLLKKYRDTGVGLVLPDGAPGVGTLAKDLVAASIPFQDERGWRVDFHALRHTYAGLLGSAGVSEGARVKMVRHKEWRQTDHYTDPNSVPLHAGMEKLSLLLPSSIASPKFGKTSTKLGNIVQSSPPNKAAEVVAFPAESLISANTVHDWEKVAVASPRGFESLPRFEAKPPANADLVNG